MNHSIYWRNRKISNSSPNPEIGDIQENFPGFSPIAEERA